MAVKYLVVPLALALCSIAVQAKPSTCIKGGFGRDADVGLVTAPSRTLRCPEGSYLTGVFGTADNSRLRSIGFACSSGVRTDVAGVPSGNSFNLTCNDNYIIRRAWARFGPSYSYIQGIKFECKAHAGGRGYKLPMIGNFTGKQRADFHGCYRKVRAGTFLRGADLLVTPEGIAELSFQCCTPAARPTVCSTKGFAGRGFAGLAAPPSHRLTCPNGAYPIGIFGRVDDVTVRGIGVACSDGSRTRMAGSRIGKRFRAVCRPGNFINSLWGDLEQNGTTLRSLRFGCGELGGTNRNAGIVEHLQRIGNPEKVRPVDFHGCTEGVAQGFDIVATTRRYNWWKPAQILRVSAKCCEPSLLKDEKCSARGLKHGSISSSASNPTHSLSCGLGSYPTGVFGYADGQGVNSLGLRCSNGMMTGLVGVNDGSRFERRCAGADVITKAWGRLDAVDPILQGLKFGCGARGGPADYKLDTVGDFSGGTGVDFHGCGQAGPLRGLDVEADGTGVLRASFKCCQECSTVGFGHAPVETLVLKPTDELYCKPGLHPSGVFGFADQDGINSLGLKCSDGASTETAGVDEGTRFERFCAGTDVISKAWARLDADRPIVQGLKFGCGAESGHLRNFTGMVGNFRNGRGVDFHGCRSAGQLRGLSVDTDDTGVLRVSFKCCAESF